MSELTEIELLKEQINNLQTVVNRLEAGETKYISMPQRVIKERSSILKKYFGTYDEFAEDYGSDKGYAYRSMESIAQGVYKIADITYKLTHNLDTSKQIKTIIDNEEKLKEYLAICDFYYAQVATQIFKQKEDNHE